MNYKIIIHKEELLDFIHFLPELGPDEVYYCVLLARSKYCKDLVHIKTDRLQLSRFVAKKEFLFEKISQLECPVGTYYQRHVPLPQEALALYINPNPRSYEKAAKSAVKKLLDLISQPYSKYDLNHEVMREIQKSCAHKRFLDMDFDDVDFFSTMEAIKSNINANCLRVIMTRGGFHVLVVLEEIDKQYKNTWYKAVTTLAGIDIKGDNMVPVVGCCQGGFAPHFVKL